MSSKSPPMVVVLDDEPSVLRSLERLLTGHGYRVRLHETSESFFRAGFPAMPACLLLDQHLGVNRGTDVYADMKARGSHLPTIFLTANKDAHTVVQAIRSGADDYLTKPYDPDELIAAVDRATRRSLAAQRTALQHEEWRRRAATLTSRERTIVSLVVSGLLNKQIADRLDLALVTVKVHRGHAMKKLGALNAADLVHMANKTGILLEDLPPVRKP